LGAEGGNDFPPEEASAAGEEVRYLEALAHRAQKDIPSAIVLLQRVADSLRNRPQPTMHELIWPKFASRGGSFEEAIQSWKDIQATHRKEWALTRSRTDFIPRRCANAESQPV